MPEKRIETSSKRIPLTPTTFEKLRDFSRGLGTSYDETIDALLKLVVIPDEDPLLAGRRFREKQNTEGNTGN
jgi:hypothetical protein